MGIGPVAASLMGVYGPLVVLRARCLRGTRPGDTGEGQGLDS